MPAKRPTHRLPLAATALSLALVAAPAVAGPDEDARAANAVRVLTDIQAIPESAIPEKLFDEGRAIVVVPDTIKAGLVIGGRRGHGLMSVKNPDGTWSNPSFVKLTGGSIGFQAGVQSSDVVLVFRSDRGLEAIVNGKFTLGADASVAAGPVGRQAATATDGELKAEIWSWSRARIVRGRCDRWCRVVHRRPGQPGRLRPRNHAADDLRGSRRGAALDRGGRLPRQPGRSHGDGASEPRHRRAGRARRGGTGHCAPVATGQPPRVETAPMGSSVATTQGSGGFQPVDDAPVISEPLPADDLPAPLPEPID